MALMFAYDPPTANATLEVQTWMQSEPPAPYWALVDVALVGSDRFKATARRHRWTPVNALANTPLQAFGEVAPHLIAISEVPQQRTAQIEQLLRLTAGTPALSWLRSAYPEPALQMLFGYLAKAQVQERPKPVHLRFADTRILPGLLQTLSPTQYRRVLDIVQGWRWFARSGEWQTGPIEPVSVDAAEMDSETHLRLSTEQFDQLLADAEADGVFYRLMLEHPVLVPPQQRAAFHQRLASSLSMAREKNLSTAQERWLFVLLSLSHGDDFHRCEALAPTWEALREQGRGLQEQMQGWSAETLKTLSDYRDRHFMASAGPSTDLPVPPYPGSSTR